MNDEDNFHQEMTDYFRIEAQRHRDIMATIADYDTKVTEVKALLATMTTKQTDLGTALKTAVADLGIAVANGHSTLIDKMVATLTAFGDQLTTMGTAMDGMETELKTALAGVPSSPIAPVVP
jgi:hypothetical protein